MKKGPCCDFLMKKPEVENPDTVSLMTAGRKACIERTE
jgi:hypothetical protein